MDCGYYCCVRFRARVWAGSWSRRVPARVVGNAASSWYTREASGVLPQSDDSMRVDGRRDKTSCEDDDSQRELIDPNPNPVSDYNISCQASGDGMFEQNASVCLVRLLPPSLHGVQHLAAGYFGANEQRGGRCVSALHVVFPPSCSLITSEFSILLLPPHRSLDNKSCFDLVNHVLRPSYLTARYRD